LNESRLTQSAVKMQILPVEEIDVSKTRVADANGVLKIDSKSPGELEITRSTSEVAVCCSSASCNSRLICTTSVFAAPPDVRLLVAFVGARPFDFDDLERRGLACLPLALERRFIAYPSARTAVSRLAQRVVIGSHLEGGGLVSFGSLADIGG
jgi:hypothetical protein